MVFYIITGDDCLKPIGDAEAFEQRANVFRAATGGDSHRELADVFAGDGGDGLNEFHLSHQR